jgi:hypothetical protein
MACRSGCLTKDHATYGECLKAANLRVGWAKSASGLDLTKEKKWDQELALYRSARSQGIQPDSTKTSDIRRAIDISEKTGTAYGNQ